MPGRPDPIPQPPAPPGGAPWTTPPADAWGGGAADPSAYPGGTWTLEAAEPDRCQVCGSLPATGVRLRAETGMLIVRRTRIVEGPLCRHCGLALLRQMTNASLWRGWWGLLSVFANLAALATNWRARSRLVSLPPPQPGTAADRQPLDPGSPLPLRSGPWFAGMLVIGLVGWVGYGLTAQAVRDPSGQIVDGGSLSVFDLSVGDCYNEPGGGEGEVGGVQAIPCSEPHEYEVYHIFDSTALDDAPYPSEEQRMADLRDGCLPAFEQYIGAPYDESRLDIATLEPTEQSWTQGDRSYTCVVYPLDQAEVEGSMRGSGQ